MLAALLCTLNVACLAAGAVAASAAEARVPSTPYRGVNSHAPWYWQISRAEVKREIGQAATLGVNVIRVPVEWAAIESGGHGVRGGKALRRLDLIVRAAAARGIKIDGTITDTPHWASPGGAGNDAPSEPQRSLRSFTRFLTRRYGTKLVAVGVWNEPAKSQNLKSPTGESLPNTTEEGLKRRAYYYVGMVKAVFNGAREGNAAVKVLVHEDGAEVNYSIRPLVFLRACFEGGLPRGKETPQTSFKGSYDAIGIHAYAEGGSPESSNENSTKSKIERVHKFLEEREGASPVPVWATEWGYSLEVSETVRAKYVEKGVKMLDTQFPYLEGWSHYQLRDTVNAPADKEENFGLLERSFRPRPSLAAFKGMLRVSAATAPANFSSSSSLTMWFRSLVATNEIAE
jgi:hypothetical protein